MNRKFERSRLRGHLILVLRTMIHLKQKEKMSKDQVYMNF